MPQVSAQSIQDLSSEEIERVINTLLQRAAWPIFHFSDAGIQFLSGMLSQLDDNRKRVSMKVGNDILRNRILHALYQRDEAFSLLEQVDFERSYLFRFIASILAGGALPNLHVSREMLLRAVQVWFDLYIEFRDAVTMRFDKALTKTAVKTKMLRSARGQVVEVEDLKNNYYIAAIRAIDRLNSERGALSTNVMRWVKSADSSSGGMLILGESYSVTRAGRKNIAIGKSSNFSTSLPLENAQHVASVEEEAPDLDWVINISQLVPHTAPFLLAHGVLPVKWTVNELQQARKKP